MLDTSLIKVKVLEETESFGKYEIEPLERGYAQTLGTTLRRVLLSSLPGAAVSAVKITGVKHEYATLPGVEEDILNIVLNLKELRIVSHSDSKEILYLNTKKAGPVSAGDLEVPSSVEILNPELIIATLSDGKTPLVMEITVENGVGYMNPENRREEIGLLPVDANFSPVDRVNFFVGSARLGQITDLDKLTLEIITKAIHPTVALHQALDIFTGILNQVKVDLPTPEIAVKVAKAEKKPAKKVATNAPKSTKKTATKAKTKSKK